MKVRYGLTLVFVSHNLGVVKNISDRVAVMYLGKLCELAPADELYARPMHHYTVGAARLDPGRRPTRATGRRARRGRRRSAVADRSAVGLPVPHSLPARRGAMRRGGAGAAQSAVPGISSPAISRSENTMASDKSTVESLRARRSVPTVLAQGPRGARRDRRGNRRCRRATVLCDQGRVADACFVVIEGEADSQRGRRGRDQRRAGPADRRDGPARPPATVGHRHRPHADAVYRSVPIASKTCSRPRQSRADCSNTSASASASSKSGAARSAGIDAIDVLAHDRDRLHQHLARPGFRARRSRSSTAKHL